MKKRILIMLVENETEFGLCIKSVKMIKVSSNIKDDDVDTILSYLVHDAQRYVEHTKL